MTRPVSVIREELADREAIRECLLKLARASDRVDEALWRECFWPEATDNHAGIFHGTIEEFMKETLPVLERHESTSHFMGNMLIEIDGTRGNAETYVLGFHVLEEDEKTVNWVASARYLDRFERRGEIWRLLERRFVVDWCLNFPGDEEWTAPKFGLLLQGAHKPDDFSYELFKG